MQLHLTRLEALSRSKEPNYNKIEKPLLSGLGHISEEGEFDPNDAFRSKRRVPPIRPGKFLESSLPLVSARYELYALAPRLSSEARILSSHQCLETQKSAQLNGACTG